MSVNRIGDGAEYETNIYLEKGDLHGLISILEDYWNKYGDTRRD